MKKASKKKVLFLKEEYANGQGKYTYPNRKSYVGDWKNGKFHGKGSLTSQLEGFKFVGKFKNDKANGHGKATFNSGEIIEGDWKDGELSGHGTYTSPDGEKYVGGWKNSEFHGKGAHTLPDGSMYEGEFKGDNRNGKGEVLNWWIHLRSSPLTYFPIISPFSSKQVTFHFSPSFHCPSKTRFPVFLSNSFPFP